MRIYEQISCEAFPCQDINVDHYVIPDISLDPGNVKLLMISEAAPPSRGDYYYAGGRSAFERTTLAAFDQAGVEVGSFQQILNLGIYLTSAVKCGKIGYGIKAGTIKECSQILEGEIALFPNVRVIMLMGDVAIKALNYIARRVGEPGVIPAESTYKIRGGRYYFRDMRVFPSYLQVGPSFGIEKSKQRMIAEDISSAMSLIR
jgi:uracil-DNA glycosylase